MSPALLHLAVNHVALFAVVFGFLALVASMIRKSSDLRMFARSGGEIRHTEAR